MALIATESNILKLVAGLFNGAPGKIILDDLSDAVTAGTGLSDLADILAGTSEFQSIVPAGQAAQVDFLLTNFGFDPTADDEATTIAKTFVNDNFELGLGQLTYLAVDFLNTTTDPLFADTAALLNNKALVAAVHADNVNSIASVAAGQAAFTGVTVSDPTTAEAALALLEDNGAIVPDPGVEGTTFELTKGVDIVTGKANDDIIIADDDGGAASLNAGDSINGGAGIDTLKIFNSAAIDNGAAFTTATVTNVEHVELTTGKAGQTLDVSGNADVNKVTLKNGFDGAVTLKAAQTAGLSGNINTAGAAATFAFSDVTGGADTANLELNAADLKAAAGSKGLEIAGVETLNIAATGISKLGDTTLADTTKLVITGDGEVAATLKSGLAKTIDGSASTGDLTIDNGAAASAVQSIKTGTGNDIYTTTYADLAADDLIDLGAGTDSLRFNDAAIFNDATTAARLTKVSGVEQLGTVNKSLTVDGDFVSQTSYYTDGAAGAFALTNIANNADVNFGAGAVQASAVGMKPGANSLNVNLAGSTTAAADVSKGLTVTDSATINVNSTGTDGVANNVLDLTAADNQSVIVTGSQNLTLTATADPATTGFSIDGSAFTGKLTATGTAASDIIKGGSGDDVISGGAGAVADTLTGNGGADAFIVRAGATAATADVITDFVTQNDTISFGGDAGSSTNYTEATAAVASFNAALLAADLALTNTLGGNDQYNVQQVGADVYVFHNNGALLGADQVVKLTGVALDGIEFADIVA